MSTAATGRSMSASDLDALATAIAAGGDVAGLGEATRFAHETFTLRDQLTHRLIEHHDFRALALQDDAIAGAALDAYVTGGPGTAGDALARAWGPWRTAETAAALEWIRTFNHRHPQDPVRIFGLKPAQVRPADYDAVLEHVRRTAPHLLAELDTHLSPIRTAHEIDEHVQHAHGLHPGRPFTDSAHEALALVEQLPHDPDETGETPTARMRRIVGFHERSVAGSGTYAGDAETWAAAISDHRRRTGARIVYWDGIAHTAATPTALGLAPDRGPQPTVGSVLRREHGSRYVSVAIGFHHGDLGAVTVPPPAPEWIDARLDTLEHANHWLDLREPQHRRAWAGPATARVISGIYDPASDASEHLTVADLPGAFDLLIHLHRVSPVRRLVT